MTSLHRLDAVCEVVMGQAPDGSTYNAEGTGWPLIAGAGDFGDVYPASKKYTASATKLSREGDIVLGIRASIGDKVWSDGIYCLGRGVAGLRAGPNLNPQYLWHWLGHARQQLVAKANGATFTQVSREDIGELQIPLPHLTDQRRIAEVLDRADELRAKRRAAIAHLDTLTHAIFLDMFGDLATTAETDPSTHLGEVLTFVTSGSRGWAQYYAPSGMRFVRSLDVQMNLIASDSAVFVDPPQSGEARRTRVQPGDVLLTITGSRIGRVAAAPEDLAGAYVSQHVAILRLDQRQAVPEFVAYFLSMEAGGQQQIAKAHYGQTKPGLNLDQIRSLHVPRPSVADQQEFKRRLTAARSVAALQEKALATLDALFSSLQHRAFRGEL